MDIIVKTYTSPAGILLLGAHSDRLCMCDWLDGKHRNRVYNRLKRYMNADFVDGDSPILQQAEKQLDEYFTGQRTGFDIPLLFVGTDFQKLVWNELLRISYGQTISYGEMARRIGHPTSIRAVANANGANAISIFVPCHRVIGSDNSLTGYVGGIDAKKYLLDIESPQCLINL